MSKHSVKVLMPNCLVVENVRYHEDGAVKYAEVINGNWIYRSDGTTAYAEDAYGGIKNSWDLKEYWERLGKEKVLDIFGTNYNHAIESAIKLYDKEKATA